MTKLIELHSLTNDRSGDSTYWRATSRRYAVTAYGRTVAEAKERLFLTRQAEYRNIFATVRLLPPEHHRHYLT